MGGWRGQLGGRQRAGASDGGRNHQKRSRWAPIFQSGDEIEALVNRSVAVAGRAAPQSISAGGDAQKGPPSSPGRCGRVSIGDGATAEGGWGSTSTVVSDRFFSAGLNLSRKSALPWLALRRPIISVPPHLPPNSTEFRFLLFSPFIFGAPADLCRTAPLPPSPPARRSAIHYLGNSTNPTNPAAKLQLPAPPCRARPRTRPSSPPSPSRPHRLRPPQS